MSVTLRAGTDSLASGVICQVTAKTDVQVVPYAIEMTDRFRGITVREGILLSGPLGWGEFCPFPEYDDAIAARWLATAVEACTVGWPGPLRDAIPVNCIVPAVTPERAAELVVASGCSTAKVKVAERPDSLGEDLARDRPLD